MQTIVGKYAEARIYAELVEQDAVSQIMGGFTPSLWNKTP